MFIKAIYRTQKHTGEKLAQYRLCESYRVADSVKHNTILHLGLLEDLPDVEQKRNLGIRINELVKESRTGIRSLFVPDAPTEKLAQYFFGLIEEKRRLDIVSGKDYERIDTHTIRHEEVREIGIEHLCYQALHQLEMPAFLSAAGWEAQQIQLALTHIISRAAYPASELRTSNWITQNSAVCTLTGYPLEKITKDKLYHISKELYAIKDGIEQHLSKRTSELFDLDDKIIIYDLTNTYFEGSMRHSAMAKFGRSKEKRNDAKLLVLAVVVNTEGFMKYSQIFEGNTNDGSSLQRIIDDLSARTSATGRRPVVVLDAGIATASNLELLKAKGFDYMCVSRSGIKKYKADTTQKTVTVQDNKGNPVQIQRVLMEGSTDNWLCVYSTQKELKESGMNSRFSQAFEQGLQQIKNSLEKKGGVKKLPKVWERIGRLKEKYPSIHARYEITVQSDDGTKVGDISWKQKEKTTSKEGRYLLRTTLNEQQEQVQWKIYNTIREIESSFRTLKTDLDLRPIYHKTDTAAMAHLHLGLLAYWVVNTIRYQLKQKGMQSEWSEIVRVMNTQKMVTTNLTNEYEQVIIIRKCSEPIQQAAAVYDLLNFKPQPFTIRKSVVPQTKNQKNETFDYEYIPPG